MLNAPPAGRGRGGTGQPNADQLRTLKLGPDSASISGKPEDFLDNRFRRTAAEFSPDGRWVAFSSNQTGGAEIFVASYPGPGGLTQISTSGGDQARWNRNGRELFFRQGDKMMAVDVDGSGSAFRAGTPHLLFEKTSSSYDVAADGQRFLMLKPSKDDNPDTPSNEYHVIVNWFDELRRAVPPHE